MPDHAMGLLPAPRHAEWTGAHSRPTGGWGIATNGLPPEDPAVRALREGLAARGLLAAAGVPDKPCGAEGKSDRPPAGIVSLRLAPDAVATGLSDARAAQAYGLRIEDGAVALAGNASPGLFYGVQTLLQLLDAHVGGLPCGAVVDWPAHELRVAHWDTKHHLDRPEALRRFLDQMAAFKLNAVCFEIEDKYEFPSHPVIGAPGALRLHELQELTAYARERHILLIPNLQAPAHMGYVLKHPEFAHLRCDGSNYQICMDDPEARRLIFDLYNDLCQATPGVPYFHVSTDEVYYAGICERFRKPYNPVNRSLTWVDYVAAAHRFLAERGRRVILWAEFPLLEEHLDLLPPDVIDGIVGGDESWVARERRLGIRQFAYASIQGEEPLFPSYFPSRRVDGTEAPGRLREGMESWLNGKVRDRNPLGVFAAAWDDSGLHNETFWLGWAAAAEYGWGGRPRPLADTVDAFMDIHYGPGARDMAGVYRDLQAAAEFYAHAWERVPSRERGPVYGYSQAKRPVTLTDTLLRPPALPIPPALDFTPEFAPRHAEWLADLPARRARHARLVTRLRTLRGRVTRNRYSVDVLLSIARLQRLHLRLLAGLAKIERRIDAAFAARRQGRDADARHAFGRTDLLAACLQRDLERSYDAVRAVWEHSRMPRNAPVNGREFLHVMDDVKDHQADRRSDLRYLVASAERVDLPGWRRALAAWRTA